MNSKSKIVIKNTIILYGRMLITVGISLYTTREVLNALGVEDFGIYNLVAGIIGMLSFLNTALTTSTQRYLSFYKNEESSIMQKKVFSNSVILHLGMGIIIVLLLQLLSYVLFNKILNINISKIDIAKEIYSFMSITVFFTILSTPFTAALNAQENMAIIALINIIEVVLKLISALLLFVIPFNKLYFYSISIAIIGIVSFFILSIYCTSKYKECTWKVWNQLDHGLIKELSTFAGWNLFGSACGIVRIQGLAVLFNVFFGAKINAAYGIANQIAGQLTFFSSALLQAINPQIMYSEGSGNRERMLMLSLKACKYSFFLLAFIAIPSMFGMKNILHFWLINVPENTKELCILILIATMINLLTMGIDSAIQAMGNIKRYMQIVGTIKLLILPIAYILLKMQISINTILLGYVLLEFIAGLLRIFILRKEINFKYKLFMNKVFIYILPPTVINIIYNSLIVYDNNKIRDLLYLSISVIIFFASIIIWGLDSNEKKSIVDFINKKMKKNLVLTDN